MNSRRAFGLVAMIALVAATGCVGGGNADVGANITPDTDTVETDVTGDEVLSSALDTADGVDTYTVESETRMDLASFFGVSSEMNTTGEFDRVEGVAYTQTEGEQGAQLLGFSGGESFETEVYRTNDARYRRSSNGSVTGDWNRSDAGAPLPPGLEDLARTVEDADATLEGVAEVDGTEAYVLSLDVSASTLGKTFSRTMDTHGPRDLGEDDGGNASEGDVNVSETYIWVDRETDRPVRFAYLVNLGFGGDGEDEAGGSMEFMTDTRYAYEEVDVEAPEGIDG